MENMSNLQYKKISKKAEGAMRITAVITSVILLIVVAAAMLILSFALEENNSALSIIAPIVIVVTVVLALADIIVVPRIRYNRYKYYLDDEMLLVVEGLFFITKSIVPIERIHQVAIKSGPIDRMFGMSNVVVTTAGGEVKIAFLETPVAEEIANRLRIRVNGIAAASKKESEAASDE